MTDNEIQEFVSRLEQATGFRAAKSHIEELPVSDYLRIRANRDACFSIAAAFLKEAIKPQERSMLMAAECLTVEGHDQVMCGGSSKMIADIELFSDWDNLEALIQKERRRDRIRDGISLMGCALISVFVLIPMFGFILWQFAWLIGAEQQMKVGNHG